MIDKVQNELNSVHFVTISADPSNGLDLKHIPKLAKIFVSYCGVQVQPVEY